MRYLTVILALFAHAACGALLDELPKPRGEAFTVPEIKELRALVLTKLAPLPPRKPDASPQALRELGHKLYFDARLSANQSVSCNSCHRLTDHGAGSELRATSLSPYTQPGPRNAPTTLNVSLQTMQGWDGRAETVKEFLRGHLLDPAILGNPKETRFLEHLQNIQGFPAAFHEAFTGTAVGPTLDQLTEALAAFLDELTTHDRFDDFLGGDDHVLNDDELNGLHRFVLAGCIKCHKGPLLGGNSLEKLAVEVATNSVPDLGRMNLTGKPEDRMVFKVPALRNVALTAPYFHDGSRTNLETAVRDMGSPQSLRKLRPEDVELIVKFLNTLSNKDRLAAPEPAPRPVGK